ncbi:MAG TPA: peptidylprolyl isomerase [Gemmataceae bacterium]|nr:peptidylprolyl isomerase [Gemmataceae bacterium]
MQRVLLLLTLALTPAMVGAAPYRPRPAKSGDDSATPRVVVDTNHGKFVIELYRDKAPMSVQNFLQYVDDQHYDGTIVHRVIPSFVIQGGGYRPGFVQKNTRDPIKNEAANGLSNERGTIAVARMVDPDSGTAQFYINLAHNARLDHGKTNTNQAGYCVFGKVVEGMEVIDRIAQVATGSANGHVNVPTTDVVIRSIRRLTN